METILAAAFGRSIDIQTGKTDELTKAVKCSLNLFQKGRMMSMDMIQMLYSMSKLIYSNCLIIFIMPPIILYTCQVIFLIHGVCLLCVLLLCIQILERRYTNLKN